MKLKVMEVKSYGYLKYDPVYERPTSRSGKPTRYNDWWLILKADSNLITYYKWWISKEAILATDSRRWADKVGLQQQVAKWPVAQKGTRITSSAWGPHVSIIRGETPPNKEYWKKYDNKKICFEYNPEFLNTNGKHWWIRVSSKDLEAIRVELGLTPQPEYYERSTGKIKVNPFHLTIGHNIN